MEGLRHFDRMARPVSNRRRRDKDCATLSCIGRDLKIDIPGGATLIPKESGALNGEVIVLANAVEAMKRGLANMAPQNPVLFLWVHDGRLVLACEALRARYALVEVQ